MVLIACVNRAMYFEGLTHFHFLFCFSFGGGAFCLSSGRSHVFDGLELNHSIGTYQLCDITDPLLKRLIESPKGVQARCRIRDGWYTSNAIEQIRSILRRKFHGLLDEKRRVGDLECVDLLDIEVGCGSTALLKKTSVGERRFGGKNVEFDRMAGQVVMLEEEEEEVEEVEADLSRAEGSTERPVSAMVPNPLLRLRRAKNRPKAKKQTGPSDLDVLGVEDEEDVRDSETMQSQDERGILSDTSRDGADGSLGHAPTQDRDMAVHRLETNQVKMMVRDPSMHGDAKDDRDDDGSEESDGYGDEDDSLTDIGEVDEDENVVGVDDDEMMGVDGSSATDEEDFDDSD